MSKYVNMFLSEQSLKLWRSRFLLLPAMSSKMKKILEDPTAHLDVFSETSSREEVQQFTEGFIKFVETLNRLRRHHSGRRRSQVQYRLSSSLSTSLKNRPAKPAFFLRFVQLNIAFCQIDVCRDFLFVFHCFVAKKNIMKNERSSSLLVNGEKSEAIIFGLHSEKRVQMICHQYLLHICFWVNYKPSAYTLICNQFVEISTIFESI